MSSTKTTLKPFEALCVAAICFGFFSLASLQAAVAGYPATRFSDAGVVDLVSLELLLALLALGFLRLCRFDLSTLLPRPSWRGSLEGLGLYLLVWLLAEPLWALFGSPGDEAHLRVLIDESRLSPAMVLLLGLVNGPFEEIFLLAVLMRGLRGQGLAIALGVPLLVRALMHVYQGPYGMLSVLIFGTALAFSYLRSGDIWPAVLAHACADIVPFLAQ